MSFTDTHFCPSQSHPCLHSESFGVCECACIGCDWWCCSGNAVEEARSDHSIGKCRAGNTYRKNSEKLEETKVLEIIIKSLHIKLLKIKRINHEDNLWLIILPQQSLLGNSSTYQGPWLSNVVERASNHYLTIKLGAKTRVTTTSLPP